MEELMTVTENTLAKRYASMRMRGIWDEEVVVKKERQLWIKALEVQALLGVPTTEGAIDAYRNNVDMVDLDSIAAREAKSGHDVAARKDELDTLAGHSLAHRAFTSRDDTENLEQLRILESLLYLRDQQVPILVRLQKRASEWKSVDTCGRSHRQAGQTTTVGKRLSTIVEELLYARKALEALIAIYTFRGFKGAMGTMQDLIDLLGSTEKAMEFERIMCERLGMTQVFDSTGQIYARSLDFDVISRLFLLTGAAGNFSRLMRDCSQTLQMNEGFKKGRKGSSAMPHKRNPSKSERIKALKSVLVGHVGMAMELVGEQEYEGDVSCSVTRRVMLADSFYAIDGIFETWMTILDGMQIYPAIIEKELRIELPFLSTTKIRDAARRAGVDDKVAYACIQEHSLSASEDISCGRPNSLLDRLANDGRLPLTLPQLEELCVPDHGDAIGQTERVWMKIQKVLDNADPALLEYSPATRN